MGGHQPREEMTTMRRTAPNFVAPRDACDCHTHVFGPADRYPFAPNRRYTPGDASVEELDALHCDLGLGRVVLVQPSVYGADNRCMVDALHRLGARARGVAVIDDATTDATLGELHRAGVRGLRLNFVTAGKSDVGEARQSLAAAARSARLGWHIQAYMPLAVIAALQDEIAALAVPLVVDHFSGARAAAGPTQPGFAALVELARRGHVYVKLSAASRLSDVAGCADMAHLAAPLIAANPDRMLWGSDWPHTGLDHRHDRNIAAIEPFLPIDDGHALNLLGEWAPDATLSRKILVENPARLYQF
jgi:predicted TIM-barrel fold metal-dependent hydrolase